MDVLVDLATVGVSCTLVRLLSVCTLHGRNTAKAKVLWTTQLSKFCVVSLWIWPVTCTCGHQIEKKKEKKNAWNIHYCRLCWHIKYYWGFATLVLDIFISKVCQWHEPCGDRSLYDFIKYLKNCYFLLTHFMIEVMQECCKMQALQIRGLLAKRLNLLPYFQ